MAKDFLLLLPTLNEEEALQALAPEIPPDFDVLVVDGGSTDGTRQLAESLGYRFVTQKFGRGKGCGVRTGMEYFLASDYRYMAMIDADYTNDPREVPRMIEALRQGSDIVLGSRDKGLQIEHLGRFSLFVNLSTSAMTSLAYGLDLPDIQTGYWAFGRKAAETLYPKLRASGFEIEYDVVYNSWREGLHIGYRPVTFRRRVGESKFTVWLRFKQIYHGLTYVGRSLALMLKQRLAGDARKPESPDAKQ
jgi:glycosyltransferase involved in cell wall biosynthesis